VTAHVLAIVLGAVALVEFVALIVLNALFVSSRRRLAALRQAMVRTRAVPRTVAGRTLKAVVDTAARVRDQGVGGMLMSSLDELTRWTTEDRSEIARVAAPDGTVTIFFSDIEGSTALNEELGDAAWVRVLEAHNALVRGAVDKFGGHVVKSQGDGFMVVFREPSQAVRAAVRIQTAFTQTSSRRLRRAAVAVRIGIHVGTAVSREGDYFGRNVAMAARVAAQAGGGEIVISDECRAGLSDPDEFVLTGSGETELKGLADTHVLWFVEWAA
jgi:class 3 adenylate cyclase